MKYKINIINEIHTNALNEEELVEIFNKKLVTVIVNLCKNNSEKGCNNKWFAL